jgi:hypothetical protein
LVGILGSLLLDECQSTADMDDRCAFHGAASGHGTEAALVGASVLSRSLGNIQRMRKFMHGMIVQVHVQVQVDVHAGAVGQVNVYGAAAP